MPDFGPRYRVLSRRGSGGIGEVFLAQDTLGGRQVAIKRLHATLAQDPDWIARFRRESEVLARVSTHPNIVTLLEAGTAPSGEPYFVMEDAGVTTLETAIQEGHPPDLAVLMPLFDALAHIHDAGAIHADIKPGSIALDRTGQPRLIDFGLAFDRATESTTRTGTGDVLATLRYASPEQSMGQPLDATSDLFSFGIVLYQCLTGGHPFGEQKPFAQAFAQLSKDEIAPPSTLVPDLAPAVDDFFARLLARDTKRRYADARSAAAALAQALSKHQVLSPRHQFYDADEIVAAAGEDAPASASRALKIFATPQQQSWLVAGSQALLFLLDDVERRRINRVRQHAILFAHVAPIRGSVGADGVGRVDIGRGPYATRWLYSVDLFPEPAALERAIGRLLSDAMNTDRREPAG
ncbi:serine/threonine-protein kinase [Sphingomonas sp. PB2P19]|uniref:serine/threonine-protein kinase n=1 Tax=Sphingomonas rhamnosi TaxID=3096156 RepID=UPI002FC8BD83